MKITVIGSAGNIGSYLTKNLVQKGRKVTIAIIFSSDLSDLRNIL